MEKVVFVTGADRGLGYDLTRQLLEQGARVFAGQYMPDWDWLDKLQQTYSKLEIVGLDVSDNESVSQAATVIQSKINAVDILINNAGISGGLDNKKTLFDPLDFQWAEHVYNVNALGALRVTNALVPMILNSQTRLVVNISSEAGSISRSSRQGWFAYCMAKAALNMQSVIVHNNIYPRGGQVIVIHPGWLQSFISGKKNYRAKVATDVAAAQILSIVDDCRQYQGPNPVFLDNNREAWPW